MSEPAPARLASIWRGEALEAVVRGHVVVVDSVGSLLSWCGDPHSVTTLRSCVKPLQALPFVTTAADPLGVGEDEVAVACASHNGEAIHVETVRRLLGRCGLSDQALSCGPQLPYDGASGRAILAAGLQPGRVHNNCSGKHAGMLAACVVNGWPTQGYSAQAHPLQMEIRRLLSDLGDIDLDAAPHGIDGCGLPTQGVPVRVLARMFAAAVNRPGFARCQGAMAAYPHMVAGRGRFDTALLTVAGDLLTLKGGGAAVWVAVRRPGGPALAIKLEAGDAAAMSAVALAALRQLGWLDPSRAADPALDEFRRPVLRNWEGVDVGAVTVDPGWAVQLQA